MEKFIIIDGNALLHRAWHAIPPLTTKKGVVVNAAFGFTSILLNVIKEFKPDYLCASFDLRKPTFRHQKFKEYKAKRVKQPDELYAQIPIIKEVLKAFDIPVYEKEGFEADDVIGTIVKSLRDEKDIDKFILTGDLDALQLVEETIKVLTFKKGIRETKVYDIQAVNERYTFGPERVVDYKALRGDASDNIPGIPGVGEKTATELINRFGGLDDIYQKFEESDIKEPWKNKLRDNKEIAYLSQELATIVLNVETDFDLAKAKWDYDNEKEVYQIFQEYEFKSLLSKMPIIKKDENSEEIIVEKELNSKYKFVNNQKDFVDFLKELKKQDEVCLDTETSSLNVFEAQLLGISFCFQSGEAYYVLAKEEFLKELKSIIENVKTIGHNIKYDYKILKLAGIELNNIYFDTLVASYLLSKTSRSLKLDDLAFSELGYRMQAIEELIGAKGKKQLTMLDVEPEKISYYSCEDADYTWQLYQKYQKELEQEGIDGLFEKIEMPLVKILADMELAGVKIDTKFLKILQKKFEKRLKELTSEIHELAGAEFNINSPKQLAEILFSGLEISTQGIKKTKTGFSTAAPELEKMKERHPIINLIFEYRELNKLQSTYVIGLLKEVDDQDRVHTNFNQTVTATGRLSSSSPNIQNIPIRTELGREIRKAFIPQVGYSLLAADYSQIELRVIASLADDDKMIDSFNKDEDIHARTAAEIHNKDIKDISKKERRDAKEVNFGVIYGLGARGLSQRTDLDFNEARDFIERYFLLYEKIRNFLDLTKERAHQNKFVETLFGRKRYIPEIDSGMPMLRAAAERVAINMPVQGTAADLMKMAMIQLNDEIKKISPEVRMLLQVHDEVVLEIPEKDIDKVSEKVKDVMESVYKLKVPIKVDVLTGGNWGECK
jgi:DNA polymerase I